MREMWPEEARKEWIKIEAGPRVLVGQEIACNGYFIKTWSDRTWNQKHTRLAEGTSPVLGESDQHS
jgi:hypothetical protein